MLTKFKPTTLDSEVQFWSLKKNYQKINLINLLQKNINLGGRNNQGRITSRRMGGGVKKYRLIDFKRSKTDIEAEL